MSNQSVHVNPDQKEIHFDYRTFSNYKPGWKQIARHLIKNIGFNQFIIHYNYYSKNEFRYDWNSRFDLKKEKASQRVCAEIDDKYAEVKQEGWKKLSLTNIDTCDWNCDDVACTLTFRIDLDKKTKRSE